MSNLDPTKTFTIKVPKKCLYCELDYSGGHALPGQPMKPGLRVFYQCGASLSVTCNIATGERAQIVLEGQSAIYCQLLFKNCTVQYKETGILQDEKTIIDPDTTIIRNLEGKI